jgi:hypothetical protein
MLLQPEISTLFVAEDINASAAEVFNDAAVAIPV